MTRSRAVGSIAALKIFCLAVDEVLVDLVGDDQQVVLGGDAQHAQGLGAREDGAGRVVRIAEQQRARAARDRRLDGVGIEVEVARPR